MPTLKLATFNINNISKRLAVLVEWLAEASPDIVCLQPGSIRGCEDCPERAITRLRG